MDPKKSLSEQLPLVEKTPLYPWLKRLLATLEPRFAVLEQDRVTEQDTIQLIRDTALARIDLNLTPLVVNAAERVKSVTRLFFANVTSTNTVSTGAKVFTISEQDRLTFVPLDYCLIRSVAVPASYMSGTVTAYDRDEGLLYLTIDTVEGEGTSDVQWTANLAINPQFNVSKRYMDAIDTKIRADLPSKTSPAFTGVPTAPTAAAGNNTTQIATTAFVAAIGALKANLASPTFTGVPAVPTAAVGTNTTQIASTAHVFAGLATKLNLTGGTLTGNLLPKLTAGAIAQAGGSLGGIEVRSAGTVDDAAFITFHRPSSHAVYLGLDTDNQLKFGGWSRGANSYVLWTALNFNPALKADLASPALTGTPTAPTAAAGTNTTQLATTAFTQAAIAALVNASPAALDTLKELADALGNDANFSTTVNNNIALKLNAANPAFTGTLTGPAATLTGRLTAAFVAVDTNAYLGFNGSAPILNFDANDYLMFNRTSNQLDWVVGGSSRMSVTSAGALTMAGGATFNGTTTVNGTLQVADANNAWYISNGLVYSTYDANDFTLYDRANNNWQWYIGGTRRMLLEAGGNLSITGSASAAGLTITGNGSVNGNLDVGGVMQVAGRRVTGPQALLAAGNPTVDIATSEQVMVDLNFTATGPTLFAVANASVSNAGNTTDITHKFQLFRAGTLTVNLIRNSSAVGGLGATGVMSSPMVAALDVGVSYLLRLIMNKSPDNNARVVPNSPRIEGINV